MNIEWQIYAAIAGILVALIGVFLSNYQRINLYKISKDLLLINTAQFQPRLAKFF